MSRHIRSRRAGLSPEQSRHRPMYARVLGLQYLNPSGLVCFVLLEGMIALGVLLALTELVDWWVVAVLPVVVAAAVKFNDIVAGALARAGRTPAAEAGQAPPVVDRIAVARAAVTRAAAAAPGPDQAGEEQTGPEQAGFTPAEVTPWEPDQAPGQATPPAAIPGNERAVWPAESGGSPAAVPVDPLQQRTRQSASHRYS